MKKLTTPLFLCLWLLPASSATAQDVLTGDVLPVERAVVDPDRNWPDPARAVRDEGVFVSPAHVLRVLPGLSKSQIYTLLDVPHYREGLFGERKWDYLLNFYERPGTNVVQCQFQIHFTRGKADGVYWRDQRCADLVENAVRQQ